MARASTSAENTALTSLQTPSAYLAVFTSDPGTTGTPGEVSGGSYARQSVTWGAASGGSMSNTNAISVPIPASTTAAYVGHFSAVTAGTYSVGAALSSSVTFNSAGTLSFAAGADSIAIS